MTSWAKTSYTPVPVDVDDSDADSSAGDATWHFYWNSKYCAGTEIHRYILDGKIQVVRCMLDNDPGALTTRFTYETEHKDTVQEGSGEPIHLAASRLRTKEMVELLVERRANLSACVTRGGLDHYDVLHAAVFAEGRGGSPEVVQALFDLGANQGPNRNEKWPLHLAFQTGAAEVIEQLRAKMQKDGLTDEVIETFGETPLEVGLKFGRLSDVQLAKAAAMTPASLKVLMTSKPLCLSAFLKRCMSRGLTAVDLAQHVSVTDIVRVMAQSPEAAGALLDNLTGPPDCQAIGWNPLPNRMSLSKRSGLARLLRVGALLNPEETLTTFYIPQSQWTYDAKKFKTLAWQDHLFIDQSWGAPILDVEVHMCHVPNLICAEFFLALPSNDDAQLAIFKNLVVRGAVSHVWWYGACRIDLMQATLSCWALSYLVFEMWYFRTRDQVMKSSGDFIAARGIVELLHDVCQFCGYARTRSWYDYFTLCNVADLARSAIQAMLLYDVSNRNVIVFVVLVYWTRVLECFNSMKNIAKVLTPITRLLRSLLPAIFVTLVVFSAFTHVNCTLHPQKSFWRESVWDTFSLLFTAELPLTALDMDPIELAMTYASVFIFTVFILNIFIGVIGEQYSREKDLFSETFMAYRSDKCLTFLMRAMNLPIGLCSERVALVVLLATCLLIGTVQVVSVFDLYPVRHAALIFTVLQVILVLTSYQSPGATWNFGTRQPQGYDLAREKSFGHRPANPSMPSRMTAVKTDVMEVKEHDEEGIMYLWLATPSPRQSNGTALGSVKEELQDLREEMRAMRLEFAKAFGHRME